MFDKKLRSIIYHPTKAESSAVEVYAFAEKFDEVSWDVYDA